MSIYDIDVFMLDGSRASLREYKDKAVLVVNVASQCGLTPQYEGLEKLHETYGPRGFTVLGFPCNQFGNQEPGTPEAIMSFCSSVYGVKFPVFQKIDVNGDTRHPLYEVLTEVPDEEKGPIGDIRWNFEKFVIAPNGTSIRRFSPLVTPEDPRLIEAVETVLPDRESTEVASSQ